ncbi:MAG: hypothetical protein ACRDYF_11900 [Acidimicrobiia bacterium]
MRFRLVSCDDAFLPLFDQAAENMAEAARLSLAEQMDDVVEGIALKHR